MDKYSIFDTKSRQPYVTFLLFCTAGLIISTPSPRPLDRGLGGNLFLKLPLFFFVYLLFSAIFGLNIGGIGAEREEKGMDFLAATAGRVLLINVTCVPMFLFQRALYPGRAIYFPLIMFYGFILSLLFAGLSKFLENPDRAGSPQSFLTKYLLLAGFFFLPGGLLAGMTNVQKMLLGGGPQNLWVEIPVAAGLGLSVWLLLITNRGGNRR